MDLWRPVTGSGRKKDSAVVVVQRIDATRTAAAGILARLEGRVVAVRAVELAGEGDQSAAARGTRDRPARVTRGKELAD